MRVKSMAEAVEWARRCPDPMPGEEFTPELRAREEHLRKEIEKQQKK